MRNKLGQFVEGEKEPWTKEHRDNHKLSFQKFKKERHWNWMGKSVSYKCLHKWIERNFGKPMICERCNDNTLNRYHWANKSGKYLRDRNDWLRLCPKCHYWFDYTRIGKKNPHKKCKTKYETRDKTYY